MPNDLQTRVREVYNWSVQLTAESRDEKWSYYWPHVIRNLLAKLRIVTGALIAVTGLQGVGKSSAMKALSSSLQAEGRSVIAVKLYSSGKLEDEIRNNIHGSIKAVYANLLKKEVINLASKNGRLATKIENIRYGSSHSKEFYNFLTELLGTEVSNHPKEDPQQYIPLLESLLPKRVRETIETDATFAWLSNTETIMIDLPDYSKTNRRAMVGDLDDAQQLWNQLAASAWRGNFITFIQKEMFGSHYFFGKMDVVEIRPFTKEQLIAAYLQTFQEHRPFTPDALKYIGSLSRGIFRRFLRYIQICLDYYKGQSLADQPIDRKLAEEAIPWEELLKDMEEELYALFPRSKELFKKALQTVILLSKNEEPLIQKEIAQSLDITEMDVSRIVEKLEAYGYVVLQRQGNEKLVKLNW